VAVSLGEGPQTSLVHGLQASDLSATLYSERGGLASGLILDNFSRHHYLTVALFVGLNRKTDLRGPVSVVRRGLTKYPAFLDGCHCHGAASAHISTDPKAGRAF
jgi:hypothetical protein